MKLLRVAMCVIAICGFLAAIVLLPPILLPKSTPGGDSHNPTPPDGGQTLPIDQKPSNRTLQQAVGNATKFLAQTQEPYALLNLNVLYRRFGIREFADSLQRYDQLLVNNPENASLPDAPMLRIFRRIADYNTTVQSTDFDAVTNSLDLITVPALFSDRRPLPDDYLSQLQSAANTGEIAKTEDDIVNEYLLTHVLLATMWLQDNHCELIIPDEFKTSVFRASAGLIDNGSRVTDIEIEAAALLYAAGQGKLVSDAFVQRVIATQNLDGGWSNPDVGAGSDWHASVLALMLLLHVEFPAASYPPMLAPALGNDGA